MNFKPLGKRVLAQRTEVEEKTASGIILVDSAKEKPNTAKVVAVGSEVSELKEGDIIVFEQFRGTELSLEGEDYLVLDIENVIGVMFLGGKMAKEITV
ncbi:MAG: co-chaperone GroES [Halarcobacter ebronensis]